MKNVCPQSTGNNGAGHRPDGKRRLLTGLLVSIFFILIAAGTAGCITQSTASIPAATPAEPPSDMESAQIDLISDLKNIDVSIGIDMYSLADKIGRAESADDVRTICLTYYGNNAWLEKIIYYDLQSGARVRVPELASDVYMTDYLPIPSREEIEEAGGILHTDCVYIPGDGYVCANYAAVYGADGHYKGVLIFVYDMYVILNLHPLITGDENNYRTYSCFITNKQNEITFSTNPEYIAETLTDEGVLYTGSCLIMAKDTKAGAYTYSSPSFSNYMRANITEKITSWQQFTSNKNTYTMYLTKELEPVSTNTKDVYPVEAEELVNAVIDAYIYALSHSKEDAIRAISSGQFSPYICAMDMEGNVLGITSPNAVDLNFMNNRDTYGVAYTEAMIYTAQQGGGYVYYMYPVEAVISPFRSQYSIGYVMPVNNEWFIFGRFSASPDILETKMQLRTDVTAVSREIVKGAFRDGIESVSARINANRGQNGTLFVSQPSSPVTEMAVIDTSGFVYAHSTHPEFVGNVRTEYVDVYGGSTARKMIMLAKGGGGLMNDLRRNAENPEYVDLWLYSIEPIDNYFFVMSGSIIGTYKDYVSEELGKK